MGGKGNKGQEMTTLFLTSNFVRRTILTTYSLFPVSMEPILNTVLNEDIIGKGNTGQEMTVLFLTSNFLMASSEDYRRRA